MLMKKIFTLITMAVMALGAQAQTLTFDAFIEAGYDMANHGYLGDILTYPAGSAPRSCYDNIITKGFAHSNVKVINNVMLSDHCLIKSDLTKLVE